MAKWTGQRLNKASDALELPETSLRLAAEAAGTNRQNLCNKIKSLEDKKSEGKPLTPSEARLVKSAEKYRSTLPEQPRIAADDGTRLAKGSEIGKLSQPPEARKTKRQMAEHQQEFVDDVLPEAKNLLLGWMGAVKKRWGDDFSGVTFDQDGNKLSELVIKATAEMNKNFPKHVEGKHDIKSTIVHEVKQLSDEDLQAQLEETRRRAAALLEQEKSAKLIKAPQEPIEAEFRDLEVAHANA